MKVIGKTHESGGDYLAVVTHVELEKLADKYYSNTPLSKLRVGDVFDLAAGYDFRADIKKACSEMVAAHKAFSSAQKTMMKFALMVGDLPDEHTTGEP